MDGSTPTFVAPAAARLSPMVKAGAGTIEGRDLLPIFGAQATQ